MVKLSRYHVRMDQTGRPRSNRHPFRTSKQETHKSTKEKESRPVHSCRPTPQPHWLGPHVFLCKTTDRRRFLYHHRRCSGGSSSSSEAMDWEIVRIICHGLHCSRTGERTKDSRGEGSSSERMSEGDELIWPNFFVFATIFLFTYLPHPCRIYQKSTQNDGWYQCAGASCCSSQEDHGITKRNGWKKKWSYSLYIELSWTDGIGP